MIYPQDMNIHDARREVLLSLLESRFKNVRKDLAAAIGVVPNYLTRMLKSSKEASSKAIGDELAVRIETLLDLAPGEMLSPALHVREPLSTYHVDLAPAQDALTEALLAMLNALSPEKRVAILQRYSGSFATDQKLILRKKAATTERQLPKPGARGSLSPKGRAKKKSGTR